MKMLTVATSAILIAMAACKSTPTTPTTLKTPTAQSITVISSSDMLYIGTSETFTATVTMSDGTAKALTGGVWSTDTPNVALVESSTGKVTIVGSGMANIIIDYQGREGVKLIRGLPNYQGSWSGSYIRVSCSDSGDPGMSCSSFYPPIGTASLTKLDFIQDHDRVTGKFTTNPSSPFPLYADAIGQLQTDGKLLLTGTVTTGPFTIQVSWTMGSTIPGQITGSLVEIYSETGTAVYVQFTGNIRDLSRTSNAGMGISAPRVSNPTLRSLIGVRTGQGAFK
jgi:hypothetical protein